jgi:predicted nucleic acid-binding protein
LQQAVTDTNILIAVMFEDDKNHAKALRIWENLERAFVPTVALMELSFFLVKHKLNLQLLGEVIRDPKVQVIENNIDDFHYLLRHTESVKYYDDVGDVAILSVSRRLGLELKTLDENLSKLSKI